MDNLGRAVKTTDPNEPLTVIPVLRVWVRIALVLMALVLVGVFTIALLLNPYKANGEPRTEETHTTPPLNLPQCTFKRMTGLPCRSPLPPSCTTRLRPSC